MTTKLLLSEVKLLLDNNMLSNKMFRLQTEQVPLNRIVQDAVDIMQH